MRIYSEVGAGTSVGRSCGTDVELPGGLNGRQVFDAAQVSRPELKALFIAGYGENAAIGNGLLGAGMPVISKPFEMTALANNVREMIGS